MKNFLLIMGCFYFYQLSADIIAEGKTKIIYQDPTSADQVIIVSKDDITAGDGLKHDIMPGKASIATNTTANTFRLLKTYGLPVAFHQQLDDTKFLAPKCTMIPYEVVIRREAHGSMIKRYPHLKKGHIFPQLVVEFFLKTSDKEWQGQPIPKDDPFIQFDGKKAHLFHPAMNMYDQQPFLTLTDYPCASNPDELEQMKEIAQHTFLILEKAWQQVGGRLVDLKIEFGHDTHGNLLLADVVDNDSWRVLYADHYIDKQIYRDGATLDIVKENYQLVEKLTSQFSAQKPCIILWRASQADDLSAYEKALKPYESFINLVTITKSMHKEPIAAFILLQKVMQQYPNAVIVSTAGKSNGLGPCLAAMTCNPVISVPATWKEQSEDIWSSLRMPGSVPLLTVLDPANAIESALHILSMQSPGIYALLRREQEKRLMNIVSF